MKSEKLKLKIKNKITNSTSQITNKLQSPKIKIQNN